MIRRLTIILIVVSLAGCTLGPDPERPSTAADTASTFANVEQAEAPRLSTTPWWTRFGDPASVELVELALEQNTDLQVAAARVLEAEAGLRKSKGSLWPQVDYQVNGSRAKSSFVLPEIGRRSIYSTSYTASLGVSYQLDLFGKLKRTRQAAWASLLAQHAAQETVQHSVIAGVIRSRVQLATAQRALTVAHDIQTSWERTLETVERRYRSGLVGAVDLHLARENLAATEGVEIILAASVEQARHALDVLVGRRPGGAPLLADTLPDLPDLEPVPAGLPVALLDRRPDLIQAEMQLSAATYGVGIALADLYPSLSLTASGGAASDSITNLLDVDSIIYNTVANLVGPIFTGGARRAEVEASRARAQAATAVYAGTVLTALREVEDALVADQANRRRLETTRKRLQEAQAADSIARQRYQRGVETFLKVLETERRLRTAEEAMITTKAELWNTRIDLFLALGGDWSLPEGPPSSDGDHEASTEAPHIVLVDNATVNEVSS